MDMSLKDYDSRTALHIAAAEGEPRLTSSSSSLLIFSERAAATTQANYKASQAANLYDRSE